MSKLHHLEETINTKTGEITSIRKSFSIKSKNTEEFYFTFLAGLNAICELTRPSDIKVLSCLCARAEFNTGLVSLSSTTRKEITTKLKISSQSLSNSLGRLKEKSLLTGDKGDFIISPQHFWKGTTDERARLLTERKIGIIVNYEFDNK